MTKRQRLEFDKALEDFDAGVDRLSRTLDVVLAIGTWEPEEDDGEDIMSGEDNYGSCD